MIASDGDLVGLELSWPVAVGTEGILAIFGGIIVAFGVAAGVAVATGSASAAGAALAAVAVVAGGAAVRSGISRARRARAGLPRLAADPEQITLTRPGRAVERLDRRRVARADYRYQRAVLGAPRSCSELTWLDERGRTVAVWTLSPLLGRAVGRWFRAVGIEGTVAHGVAPVSRTATRPPPS